MNDHECALRDYMNQEELDTYTFASMKRAYNYLIKKGLIEK